MITLMIMAALAVVLNHCLHQIATLSHKKWQGHQVRFAGFALAHALVAGGAAGCALGMGAAPLLLLVGIAGKIIFDRRIRLP